MADLTPFPDIEVALVELLADLAPGGTATPPNLEESMPYLRIKRFGGPDDLITDTAAVSIDAFAAVRADARSLAESVRQRLITGPHVIDNDVITATIDRVTTTSWQGEVPWSDDQSVRRFAASYQVLARRPN